MRKPNAKIERFCVLYVRTGNASEAYRLAFRSRAKPKSANEIASRLLTDVNVQSRVQELREVAADEGNISIASHIRTLHRLRELAVENRQISAAVTAEKARGEVSGFYAGVRNPLRDPPPAPAEPDGLAGDIPGDNEVARALLVLRRAEQLAGKAKRSQEPTS